MKQNTKIIIFVLLIIGVLMMGKDFDLFAFITGEVGHVDYALIESNFEYQGGLGTEIIFTGEDILLNPYCSDCGPYICQKHGDTVWFKPIENMYGYDIILNFKDNVFNHAVFSGGNIGWTPNHMKFNIDGQIIDVASDIGISGCTGCACSYGAGSWPTPLTEFKYIILSDIDDPYHIKMYFQNTNENNLILDHYLSSTEFYPKFIYSRAESITLDNLKVRRPCTGDLQVDQVFHGPQVIDHSNLGYASAYFCPQTHSEKFTGEEFTIDPTINDVLELGGLVDIPTGQLYKLRYYIDYAQQVTIACEDEYINWFDFCEKARGFVNLCAEGVMDPIAGTCSQIAGTAEFCTIDFEVGKLYGRYDTEDKLCYFNPPQEGECVFGTPNPVLNKCTQEPECGDEDFNFDNEECCGSIIPAYNPFTGFCEEITNLSLCTTDADCDAAEGFNVTCHEQRCIYIGAPSTTAGISVVTPSGGGGGGGYSPTEEATAESLTDEITTEDKPTKFNPLLIIGAIAIIFLIFRKRLIK